MSQPDPFRFGDEPLPPPVLVRPQGQTLATLPAKSMLGPAPAAPSNPFAVSTMLPAPALGKPQPQHPDLYEIEYLRSYNYIFENPNWVQNVLWGALCALSTVLIPVLGQLVVMGYVYECIQVLFQTRGRQYPDFDFNRLGEYLSRSIGPFVVSIVLVVPMVLLLYAGMFAIGIGAVAAGAAAGEEVGPIIGAVVFFGGLAAMVLAFQVVQFLLHIMMLKAGLQQDIAAGFDIGWALDFFRRTWVEIILTTLFLGLTGMIVLLLSGLMLCVGMFAGIVVIMLAQAYVWYQLYALYLTRGGQPIPLKPIVRKPAQPQYRP
jgi:hypothetical protein